MSDKWPKVQLTELLTQVWREEAVVPCQEYPLIGAHWYAKGLYVKEVKPGQQIRSKHLYRIHSGDFVYNRLFAWKGSFAIVSADADGCFVSNEFPCFVVDPKCIDCRYLWLYFQRESSWLEALGLSAGATPTSRNRLKESRFLKMRVPLPPLQEQQRIVARIEQLTTKIEEVHTLRGQAASDVNAIVMSKLRHTIRECGSRVRYLPFTEIARLERRPVSVQLDQCYQEIGTYSFGRGIFHKVPRTGAEIGDKRLYQIRAGDLILQITFAWEGAVALAEQKDDGLFCSVRYLTFRVNEEICSPWFLLTYMKTPEAVSQLGVISRGSAGRNRVLSVKRLGEIAVPVVPAEYQRWMSNTLRTDLKELERLQAEAAAELDGLRPSILDRAFEGGL